MPLYEGIDQLHAKGDQIQWGGPVLFADGRFATPDGKAHFSAVTVGPSHHRDGVFSVSTRRGKQFNAMVQREEDPLTGARREDVFISADDLARLGLDSGVAVRLRSAHGTFDGRLKAASIKPGNLEVHWPEGNTLLSGTAVNPESMEPDYNAEVTIEAVG